MIHVRTRLVVADNTGAKELAVFSVSGKNAMRHARLGDVVAASVKVSSPTGSVKKGDKVYAVIVRMRKAIRRSDGSYIRFDENAVVLVEKGKKEPRGGRIFGPIPREIAELGYQKIISMAPEVV